MASSSSSSSSPLVFSIFLNSQYNHKPFQTLLSKTFLFKFAPIYSLKNHCTTPTPLRLCNNVIVSTRLGCFASKALSTISVETKTYEFSDCGSEVELKLHLGGRSIQNLRDVLVDASESSLAIRARYSGSLIKLMEVEKLYERIKPAETIWYIDEGLLVVNLKKHDPDLRWPDVIETWESLTAGIIPLLKGMSIYLIGDSTEINWAVARELAIGLGYTPLSTSELLESFAKQTVDSWLIAEGADSVAQAEAAILEVLSSHVRAVVATVGGNHGAAGRDDKWRHLHAGFTVWLSQSKVTDEASAKEEVQRHMQDGNHAHSNADVVVKLGGWDPALSQTAAQACLSALKQLILSDKKLPGKKNLYIRLGCRGDWPNIKLPGWDPSSGIDESPDV